MPETASRKREIVATLAVLIVIVVIVTSIGVANKKRTTNSLATTTNTTANTTQSSSLTTTSASYKDGEYSASGSYDSPGGSESITVSVTLKSGVVTATSAKSGANDNEAEEYQSQFIDGYKSQVVGKNIAEISLSRVSGSSLTSQGFNDAIAKIKSQAQA